MTKWNVPLCKCVKCGYEWFSDKLIKSEGKNKPVLCPRCKSPTWDKK